MAFRDEGEALRQRAETAEREQEAMAKELAVHRNQAERLAKMEEELAQARELLARVQGQLDGKKPAEASRRARLRIGLGLAALFVLGVAAATSVFLRGGDDSTLHDPRPAAAPFTPEPPGPTEAVAPPVEKRARWNGRVTVAEGIQVAVGAPCVVDAVLRSKKQHDVTISCGGKTLYKSVDTADGTSVPSQARVTELPGAEPGTAHSRLLWEDGIYDREPRVDAKIDTETGGGSVVVDGTEKESFQIGFTIDAYSEPYQGAFDPKHRHEDLEFQDRIDVQMKVTNTNGPAPVKVGTVCKAWLHPSWELTCRGSVRCGDVDLYGSTFGRPERCAIENGKPVALRDESARFDWDVVLGTVRLRSIKQRPPWEVELAAELNGAR